MLKYSFFLAKKLATSKGLHSFPTRRSSDLLKSLFVTVFVFAANLTVFASNPETELIYNTEEIDGVKMSETVYKMNEGILTNFEKYNYKYNDKKQVVENVLQKWDEGRGTWRNHMCIKYTYNENSTTIQYYKWNKNKKDYILVPEMTVTMDM